MSKPLKWRSLAVMAAATTAAWGVPSAASAASTTTAPTATINVWWVTNGTDVNNLWSQIAKNFDKAHPGDTVNIEISSPPPTPTRAR